MRRKFWTCLYTLFFVTYCRFALEIQRFDFDQTSSVKNLWQRPNLLKVWDLDQTFWTFVTWTKPPLWKSVTTPPTPSSRDRARTRHQTWLRIYHEILRRGRRRTGVRHQHRHFQVSRFHHVQVRQARNTTTILGKRKPAAQESFYKWMAIEPTGRSLSLFLPKSHPHVRDSPTNKSSRARSVSQPNTRKFPQRPGKIHGVLSNSAFWSDFGVFVDRFVTTLFAIFLRDALKILGQHAVCQSIFGASLRKLRNDLSQNDRETPENRFKMHCLTVTVTFGQFGRSHFMGFTLPNSKV